MTLIIDKEDWRNCQIDTDGHIAESLGKPMELPNCMKEALSDKEEVCKFLSCVMETEVVEYADMATNTYDNGYGENDLSRQFSFKVYGEATGTQDWCWKRDVFVIINDSEMYRCDDPLADGDFLAWRLDWFVEPMRQSMREDPALYGVANEISEGYSSDPKFAIEKWLDRRVTASDVKWVEKRQGYVCRFRGISCATVLFPLAPSYS
jgi:hypothetical protein